ncbi:MAG: AmmeMemoRadiSam system protein A [Fusobacteriota bacterium]
MYKPKSIYVKLAMESIKKELNLTEEISVKKSDEEKFREKHACFVTLHTSNGDLRGCIGTILPTREDLYSEIVENAISASFKDPRFSPLDKSELENIEISVDILSEPEKVDDISELDPKKYGIIVSHDYNKGVLLPDLEGVDSIEEQIRIAKTKAGLYGVSIKQLVISKFEVTRYH